MTNNKSAVWNFIAFLRQRSAAEEEINEKKNGRKKLAFDVKMEWGAGRLAQSIGGDARVIARRVALDLTDDQRLIR